ncbi:integrase arm-type DNA-binding domain-containing protein [Halomonas sp. CUBES01]|uniref:tyrosine-type recombinase/integrase n=1 Tax=Halomonas sp. CUBES01 TaxID=2897340 RepID=UPI001E5B6E37|nr:site-specific integrase [Halomonas sp. CUBES01]MEC4766845.1 integrase arm-type DNA-binding domain-containing protein [Halomonas sp. CUBES01]
MPKKARELSAIEVKRLSEPGRHAVGGVSGLYLQVTPGAGRSWILRTLVGKRRREMGLGGYPDIGLADAREAAREARKRLLEGEDPIEQRQAARRALIAEQQKLMTFDQCTAAVIEVKRQEARNAKHAKQWETTLATYASPELGKLAVGEIELAHIVNVLEPHWTTKTETMTRVRQRIETVMAWAIARGYRDGDNPARWRGNLDAILPKPSKVAKVAHHKALPYHEIAAFMHELRRRNGTAARALEFTILTAARSGEVRGATWDEIDLAAGIWTVPGERMKTGREHRVPLPAAAIKLLKDLPRHEGINLVFPAPRLGQLSDAGMSSVLKRMGVDVTVHGFRSTFRDWTAEQTSTPHHVAEMALAHTIKNSAEAAYRRGDMLDKRRRLMEQWADYCASTAAPAAAVTPIREASR